MDGLQFLGMVMLVVMLGAIFIGIPISFTLLFLALIFGFMGLGVTVFVSVKTAHHDLAWLRKFAAGVRDMPEVTEFYRMSGDTDYLLKVVVPDIAGFDRVYKKLIQVVELFDVSSSFAMEEIKYTTALPLDYV